MSGDDVAARPTTASIDRRVERLETAQADMNRQLALVSQEQGHLRELMQSGFTSQRSELNAMGTKLDAFMGRIDGLIQQGMTQAGDLRASAVGRDVADRLEKLETTARENRSMIDQAKGLALGLKLVFGTSLVSLVLSVVVVLNALGVL